MRAWGCEEDKNFFLRINKKKRSFFSQHWDVQEIWLTRNPWDQFERSKYPNSPQGSQVEAILGITWALRVPGVVLWAQDGDVPDDGRVVGKRGGGKIEESKLFLKVLQIKRKCRKLLFRYDVRLGKKICFIYIVHGVMALST